MNERLSWRVYSYTETCKTSVVIHDKTYDEMVSILDTLAARAKSAGVRVSYTFTGV